MISRQRQRTKRYDRAPTTANDSRSTSSAAMDIDKPSSKHQSPRQVPQDERLRRNQEKACYYCGVSGHFSNQCPAKRNNNQRQTISTVLLGEPEFTYPSINMWRLIEVQTGYRCVHVRYNHQESGMVYIPVRVGPNETTGP
ncbi:hypothetical protein HPULCUR_003327 [Helicostylum pulchrum]|uniref:CCHC-type domain-containing protein n=1 Tax=Helicostylum pulchrum TaxID=562976 RepID=A0ABP9XT15_9FUNG